MKKDDLDDVDAAIRWTVITVALAFVGTCLVVLLTLWVERAEAAEITPLQDKQAASIYAAAYGQYGGALPERAPTVHLVTPAKLHELAGCNHCAIRALHREGHIYIDETLDFSRGYDASILLHEMVHYLQYVALGPTRHCEDWLAREQQAYLIQAEVLYKAHEDSRPIINAARQLIATRPCREPGWERQ